MFPLRARDVPCAVLAGGLSLFVLPSLCRFAVVWDVRFGYFEACTKSRVPKYPSLSSISGFPLGEGMPRLEDAPQCNGPPIFARRASLLFFFFFLPRLCRPASTPFRLRFFRFFRTSFSVAESSSKIRVSASAMSRESVWVKVKTKAGVRSRSEYPQGFCYLAPVATTRRSQCFYVAALFSRHKPQREMRHTKIGVPKNRRGETINIKSVTKHRVLLSFAACSQPPQPAIGEI